MEVSFAEVKKQVDELPIGYYAKRRVPMVVDKETPYSYYNPMADEICISYNQIAIGMASAKDEGEEYKETAIRSMVYHELSHAILTPEDLMNQWDSKEIKDVLNVFEDERIETILRDFYMNVNFKKNILYVNGGEIKTPTSAFTAFYNLVRFRAHKNPDLLAEVRKIIHDFPDNFVFPNDERGRVHDRAVSRYRDRIITLWNKVKKDFSANGADSSPSQEELNEMAEKINEEGNSGEGYDKNDKADENKKPSNGKSGENGEGEGEEGNGVNGRAKGDSGEQGEDGKAEAEGADKSHDHSQDVENERERNEWKSRNGAGGKNLQVFQSSLNKYHDTKQVEMLKAIIETFNKKNASGNGTHGYSGIFNPRNVANENYKYFDRRLSSRGNNKFGKFHLNLFVDESGSFCTLEDSANTIIKSLTEVEKVNPNFSFDLICDTEGFREMDKKHRVIKAGGGNELRYDEVVDVMKKHTAKNAYTYNIVLHDGWVDNGGDKNFFLGWDRNNVTIIDTGDNKEYFEDVKNARVVVVPRAKLVTQLGEEVAKSLQCAFR